MKKIFIFLFITLTTITCHAQIEHLTFMGIPIDGKLKDFHKELKKKGFRRISTSSYNTWSYEGIFSWDKVKIVVYFLTSSLVRYFYLPHDGTYGFKGVSEDLTGDSG